MDETRRLDRRQFLKYSGMGLAGLALSQMLAGCTTPEAKPQGDDVGSPPAKDYPTRPITWYTFQQPGGSLDNTTRLIQPYVTSALGVPVVMDYEVGAGGSILRASTYKADPDGYRLHTDDLCSMFLAEKVAGGTFKAREFTPLVSWTRQGMVWCVKKGSPIKTFDDLLAEMKKRRVTVGDLGAGGSGHLQLAVYKDELDVPFEIVHFDGSTPTYTALLGGHIDCGFTGSASASRNRDNLDLLAVQDPDGDQVLPDVPTMKSLGYDVPQLVRRWLAVTTPGVPEERAQLLVDAIMSACNDPDHNDRQLKIGCPISPWGPKEIRAAFDETEAIVKEYQDLL